MRDNPAPDIEPEAMPHAARAIADAWRHHDKLALARLTPAQRRAQLEAREVLLDLVEDCRQAAEQRGHDVDQAPEGHVVAAMGDLLGEIRDAALYACLDDDRRGRA